MVLAAWSRSGICGLTACSHCSLGRRHLGRGVAMRRGAMCPRRQVEGSLILAAPSISLMPPTDLSANRTSRRGTLGH
jgi:hypothetical protein